MHRFIVIGLAVIGLGTSTPIDISSGTGYAGLTIYGAAINSGNKFVVGSVSSGPGSNTNVFVGKVSDGGGYQWTRSFSELPGQGYGIAASGSNVYITGTGSSISDGFLAKISNNGSLVWYNNMTGSPGYDLATSDNNVFVLGFNSSSRNGFLSGFVQTDGSLAVSTNLYSATAKYDGYSVQYDSIDSIIAAYEGSDGKVYLSKYSLALKKAWTPPDITISGASSPKVATFSDGSPAIAYLQSTAAYLNVYDKAGTGNGNFLISTTSSKPPMIAIAADDVSVFGSARGSSSTYTRYAKRIQQAGNILGTMNFGTDATFPITADYDPIAMNFVLVLSSQSTAGTASYTMDLIKPNDISVKDSFVLTLSGTEIIVAISGVSVLLLVLIICCVFVLVKIARARPAKKLNSSRSSSGGNSIGSANHLSPKRGSESVTPQGSTQKIRREKRSSSKRHESVDDANSPSSSAMKLRREKRAESVDDVLSASSSSVKVRKERRGEVINSAEEVNDTSDSMRKSEPPSRRTNSPERTSPPGTVERVRPKAREISRASEAPGSPVVSNSRPSTRPPTLEGKPSNSRLPTQELHSNSRLPTLELASPSKANSRLPTQEINFGGPKVAPVESAVNVRAQPEVDTSARVRSPSHVQDPPSSSSRSPTRDAAAETMYEEVNEHPNRRPRVTTQEVMQDVGIIAAPRGGVQPQAPIAAPLVSIADYSKQEYSFFDNGNILSGPFAPIASKASSSGGPTKSSLGDNTMQTQHSASEYTSTFTQVQTMISNQRELSLPGFLQYKLDVDFAIRQQVARGGSASVFLAKILTPDLRNRANGSNLCVAKVLNTKEPTKEDIASFSQEISIMWFFRSNRNFAKLLGFTTTPPTIVMKHYQRGSLADLIYNDSQNISWTSHVLFCLLKDVAVGLKEMHEAGFVHSDIKPGNILIEEDDFGIYAVLADFGISQIVNNTALLVQAFRVANIDGVSVGYAAPEVLKRLINAGNSLSPEAPPTPDVMKAGDVFSYGMVSYELINRTAPWPKSMSAQEVIQRVLKGERPKFSSEVVDKKAVDKKLAGICDIMSQCWTADPVGRLQMNWILEILEQIQNSSLVR